MTIAKPIPRMGHLAELRVSPYHDVEFETVDCPLCGDGRFETLVESPDSVPGAGATFRVVRCRSCGLAFTNPRPTLESMALFYPAGYGPHEGREWDASWRGRLRRSLELAVLQRDFNHPARSIGIRNAMLALLGKVWIRGRRRRSSWIPFTGAGQLLDFGCGAAGFARRMKEYGWSVQGVELSAEVAARVQHETGIQVHVGSIPHPDVPARSMDAITMWSSLEHVHEPRRVVRAAREALRPGGLLLVQVPNLESWSFRKFRQAWYGLDLPRHLVHFTPNTLCELLAGEGFRLRELRQIGRVGWLRASVRRAQHAGSASRWHQLYGWKPLSLAVSRWSETRGTADSMLALAESP